MTRLQLDLILVLDQAPEIRELLRAMLTIEGYRVVAPAFFPEDPDEVVSYQPGLIILDHFLGTPSPGWRFLRRLRTNLMTRQIPVLVCTAAVAELRKREVDLTAHGVQVVRKPFDLDEFLGTIREALDSRRAGHAADPVGAPTAWHQSGSEYSLN